MQISTFDCSLPATAQRLPSRAISRGWLAGMLLFTGPAAFAQLNGAYTINNAQATGGTNYASFTAAAAALTASGVSGPVTFSVSGGPYTEQFSLGPLAGVSATNRVTFNGNGSTIQFGNKTAAQPAVVTLNGADYVTLNNLVVDATAGGTNTSPYDWGIEVVNNSNNCVISNCAVTASTTAVSGSTFSAGIVSNGSVVDILSQGTNASQDLTVSNNTVTGGYYGIAVVGRGTTSGGFNTGLANTPGIVLSNNTVRDFYFYGIYLANLIAPTVSGNDIARPTRTRVSAFYGLDIAACSGATVEKNRLHNPFTGSPNSNIITYGILVSTGTARAATPTIVSNNLIYNIDGNGSIVALNNFVSSDVYYYYNTVLLDNQAATGSGDAWGFGESAGEGCQFKNNIIQVTRTGTGNKHALHFFPNFETDAREILSDYNDLVVGSGSTSAVAYTNQPYPTLAAWRAGTSRTLDANSISVPPLVANAATGNLQPTAGALNGAATPLAQVPTDITGAPRSLTAPDIGAYEFTSVLSTRPRADEAGLTVFPNPSATGQLTCRLDRMVAAGSAELLNALGQVMQQQPLVSGRECVFSMRGLAAGLYTLRVQAESTNWMRRVVVQ